MFLIPELGSCAIHQSGFPANATHATNVRNDELTQAPADRNRAVLFPAKLVVQILVRFLQLVQLTMKTKFNFNNVARVCHSLAACQRHTPSSLAAVIGLSNDDVISLCSLRFLRCVRHFVNALRALRWLETPPYSLRYSD